MSSMNFLKHRTHVTLNRLYLHIPSSPPFLTRRKFGTNPLPGAWLWYPRNGSLLRGAFGCYGTAATISLRWFSKSSDQDDVSTPMKIVLRELRIQEKSFKHKVHRNDVAGAGLSSKLPIVNHFPLSMDKLELYKKSTSKPSPEQLLEYAAAFQTTGSASVMPPENKSGKFDTLTDNNLTQIFTHSDPPLAGVRNKVDKKLDVPLVVPKLPPQSKDLLKDTAKITQTRPPLPKIIYPTKIDKPQINFKLPHQSKTTGGAGNPKSTLEPPKSQVPKAVTTPDVEAVSTSSTKSSSNPKFPESSTQRIKANLIDNSIKPSDTIANDLNSLKYKVDVKNRIFKELESKGSKEKTEVHDKSNVEIFKGPRDMLGNPIPPPETKLITSMMDKEMNVVPVLGTKKQKTKEGAQSDGDDTEKKSQSTKWKIIKCTFGFIGLVSTCVGGYLLVMLGSPKYDENDNVLLDKYSHMPMMLQYYFRIKDQVENYNKMLKEPSREKLLPDILQHPYYQPPYTLILEFTDLLVHPEWTYQTGWRFKKRPGVDQFLEALYTRFEVVVYTAQMGMTVFPILEALDNKNLISYKLVRDATNFIDGDHVKDLDKLNRDLSKVVVVDWNTQSVKLHRGNLFKIPRWEGNDDDRTLYDVAAFLIAISEWEVQDVRSVLEYYRQFDNPLLKFKENQMQVLQSTQS